MKPEAADATDAAAGPRTPEPGEVAEPMGDGELLVFDLDGVLVDVSRSYRRAIAHTVLMLGGGKVAADEIQALKNEGGFNNDWDLSRELLRRRGREVERPRVIEIFNRIYQGKHWDGLILRERWLLPPELVAELSRRYRLAIYTGRPREDAEFVLRRFGVREAFVQVVAMEDVSAGKPAPDGLLQLQWRFAPARLAAYIGDTVDDARCAAAARVPFIGVMAPGQPRPEELAELFDSTGCRFVAANVAEACRRLLQEECAK